MCLICTKRRYQEIRMIHETHTFGANGVITHYNAYRCHVIAKGVCGVGDVTTKTNCKVLLYLYILSITKTSSQPT